MVNKVAQLSTQSMIYSECIYIEEEEEVFKLGLCATLLAPSSIDAWRTIWGVGV